MPFRYRITLHRAFLTLLVFGNAVVSMYVTAQPARNAPMPTYIEEFFRSEAVRSEEKGELQSTLGVEGFRRNGGDAVLEFEYGLTDRLQFSAELPYGFRSTEQAEVPVSWSTVNIGAEYQFVRSSRPMALTAGLAADLPAASRGKFAWEPEILVAKQLSATQLHAGFVADLSSDTREYDYSLASVTNLHSRWFPTLEFNGHHGESGNTFYLTPGIYRHLQHRMEAGFAASAGSYFGIVGKVTWEIGGDRD
jgi:hypothetical protein